MKKYTVDDFWARVAKSDGCWLWTGSISPNGYGRFGDHCYAHRYSFELAKGPIPSGMEIDHLCRTRHCVNPDHLEAVTHRENDLRGSALRVRLYHANRCIRGHDLRTAYVRKEGQRMCRQCDRIRRQLREQRKAAAA